MASTSALEEKIQLLLSVGEECVTEDELRNVLAAKNSFRLYDAFSLPGECTLLRFNTRCQHSPQSFYYTLGQLAVHEGTRGVRSSCSQSVPLTGVEGGRLHHNEVRVYLGNL
eukprot:NODE_7414_length_440_cov_20.667732_g7248_i0.p1 GENE.NODE_7414_length_440_cov_20.667732_g7248_i0~~NODE_7414_length_440_cov_20.667732_g7248_i0.p1  ORF type:complete len:112 (+),score=2.11 NODE_7414_length_440_cov_20.667732_g7248_i0:93-428(+)